MPLSADDCHADETLSASEVEERWPPLIAQEGWEGLYQEDTGILHADTAVRTLQEQARAAGAALFDSCVVCSIVGGQAGERVVVTARDGRSFTADKCVVCAGAWAGKLLQAVDGLSVALQPTQNTVAYWPTSRPEAFKAGAFPVLISGGLYSLPSFFDDEHGYWKLDWHGGPPIDPDQSTADPSRGQPELDRVSDYIRRHVRWVDPEPTPARTTPCMYTMTLDQEFIIDSLPGRPAIAVGAGFSGHGESSNGLLTVLASHGPLLPTGFKLAPVVGRILSQLALGGKAALDEQTANMMHNFAIDRPAVTTPRQAAEFPNVTQVSMEEEAESEEARGPRL